MLRLCMEVACIDHLLPIKKHRLNNHLSPEWDSNQTVIPSSVGIHATILKNSRGQVSTSFLLTFRRATPFVSANRFVCHYSPFSISHKLGTINDGEMYIETQQSTTCSGQPKYVAIKSGVNTKSCFLFRAASRNSNPNSSH